MAASPSIATLYAKEEGFVLSLLAGRAPAADVPDLAQEVWVKALRYPAPNPSRAWLRTLARSVLVDYLRHKSRTPVTPLIEEWTEQTEPDVADTVATRMEVEAAVERLNAAPGLLDGGRSLLRWAAGESTEEIAEAEGISAGNVRQRVFKGRAVLAGAR